MKIVWVNGCFDVLHRGHIELFEYAKSLGDFLVVGIDSDDRIRENKGPSRPINNYQDRKFFLKSIKYVDEVIIFGSNTELENWIKFYEPDILVVGSEYRDKGVVGSEHAKNIEFFDRVKGHSTSKILEKIQ
jgi:D-beta-D-heptose 7-phosphate kinase/D-beta-D-heptose 1-phosphate adenosyltransferase